jgi:hypothetical protein
MRDYECVCVNWREAGAMWLSAADGVIEARATMDGLYFGQPTPICFLFLVFLFKEICFRMFSMHLCPQR